MRRSTLFLLICATVGVAALIVMLPPRTPESVLSTNAQSSSLVPRPSSRITPVVLPTDPVRGPRDAPLTIVVFSDFTCPACADAATMLGTLAAAYGERLRVVWKDLPHLDRITGSRALHVAAACAQAQGKFWEVHDAIFRDRIRTDAGLDAAIAQLGLDARRLRTCRADPAVDAAIATDVAEASRLGVRGTPTFFVNGVRLEGAPTIEQFRAILNAPPAR